MADSARKRTLDNILAKLQVLPGVAHASKDLEPIDRASAYPALYVVAASGGGPTPEPGGMVKEEMAGAVWGYVKSESGKDDGISDQREALYKLVFDLLFAQGVGTLQASLVDDARTNNGNGASMIAFNGPPDVDEGQLTALGWFRLPFKALLHYERGAL